MLPGIFIGERPVLYNRYRLGPGPWIRCEEPAALGPIYGHGMLPLSREHSGPWRFFEARSLRVETALWHPHKKRRHQQRSWEAYSLRREALSREDFLQRHRDAASQAHSWMEARFGAAYLDPQRLHFLLHHPLVGTVLTWSRDRLEAFALLVHGDWGAHYWFVFYEASPTAPPGHGYLMDFLAWTRTEGLPFAYLGSVYGRQSLYKWRGFAGAAFWTGKDWSTDRARLAAALDQDDARPASSPGP